MLMQAMRYRFSQSDTRVQLFKESLFSSQMFKIKTITILATVIMLLHVFIIRYSLWKNYPESNFAPATRSARALGVKISPVAGTCSLECEKKKKRRCYGNFWKPYHHQDKRKIRKLRSLLTINEYDINQ